MNRVSTSVWSRLSQMLPQMDKSGPALHSAKTRAGCQPATNGHILCLTVFSRLYFRFLDIDSDLQQLLPLWNSIALKFLAPPSSLRLPRVLSSTTPSSGARAVDPKKKSFETPKPATRPSLASDLCSSQFLQTRSRALQPGIPPSFYMQLKPWSLGPSPS